MLLRVRLARRLVVIKRACDRLRLVSQTEWTKYLHHCTALACISISISISLPNPKQKKARQGSRAQLANCSGLVANLFINLHAVRLAAVAPGQRCRESHGKNNTPLYYTPLVGRLVRYVLLWCVWSDE